MMAGIRRLFVGIVAMAILMVGAPFALAQQPPNFYPAPTNVPSQPNGVRPATHAAEPRLLTKPDANTRDDLPLSASASGGEKPKASAPFGAMVSVVFSLAVVLGLFLFIAWLMRRGMPAMARTLPSGAVEVLGRTPLAGRQQMHLVRFGNKMLLVCVSPEGANLLSEVTDPSEIDRLSQMCGSATTAGRTKKPNPIVRQVALLLSASITLFASSNLVAQEPLRPESYPVTPALSQEPAKISAGGRLSVENHPQDVNLPDVALEKIPSTNLPDPSAPLAGLDELSPSRWTSPEGVSSTLKVVLTMGALSLAPALALMTTSFVRIVIVLGLLRQALGTQQLPPNQVMTAAALFLTLLVMWPTWKQTYEEAVVPYSERQIDGEEAWQRGCAPIRRFMSAQIKRAGNDADVLLFYKYLPQDTPPPQNYGDVPLVALAPAFLLSELKTAFLIGFQIFLPFVVIDLVVSSITVAMGMMMLPPAMIALPFKLLLFVLVDGWHLIVEMLLQSFQL